MAPVFQFSPSIRKLSQRLEGFLQKNYRLSEELLITAKTLGLDVTPGLGLRQAFADSAGQKSVVWRMNRQAEPAATEILGLFEHLFAN
jgi:hypothetical protein